MKRFDFLLIKESWLIILRNVLNLFKEFEFVKKKLLFMYYLKICYYFRKRWRVKVNMMGNIIYYL